MIVELLHPIHHRTIKVIRLTAFVRGVAIDFCVLLGLHIDDFCSVHGKNELALSSWDNDE